MNAARGITADWVYGIFSSSRACDTAPSQPAIGSVADYVLSHASIAHGCSGS
jgi:hypothetical protein